MKTYCTSCGKEIPETNEYCTNCGARAYRSRHQPLAASSPPGSQGKSDNANPTIATPSPEYAIPAEKRSPRESNSPAWIFVTIAILAIMVVGSWAVMVSNTGKKTQAGIATAAQPPDASIPADWVLHTRQGYYSVHYPPNWETEIEQDDDWEVTPWIDAASTAILCTPRLAGDTVEDINRELIDWDKEQYSPVRIGDSDWRRIAGEQWLVTDYSLTLKGDTMAVRMFVTLHGDYAYVLQYTALEERFTNKWEDYFRHITNSFVFE